jgi:hypothetical protein
MITPWLLIGVLAAGNEGPPEPPLLGAGGGGWVELDVAREARRTAEKRKREIWRSIERTIEEAYATATGGPRKEIRAEVRQELAQRDPARIAAIAARLAETSDPEALKWVKSLNARLAELEQAALVYERMEQQARMLWARQNDDAVTVLLMVD